MILDDSRRMLKLASEKVGYCQKQLSMMDYETLRHDIKHLRDLLDIAVCEGGSDGDLSVNSIQIPSPHPSMSFQQTTPTRLGTYRRPTPTIPHSSDPNLFVSHHPLRADKSPSSPKVFVVDDVADIADVGPPLSPPSEFASCLRTADPTAEAIQCAQEEADREESEIGSVEVEQDLQHR